MNNIPTSKGLHKFLENISDSISEAIENNPESLKASLESEGINYDELVTRGKEFIDSIKRDQDFAEAREKRGRILELFERIKSGSSSESREDKIEALKLLFTPKKDTSAFQAYFHKLESLNENDIDSMMEDSQLLNFLKKSDEDG